MIFNCNISEIVHESSTTVIMIFLTDDNISLNCGYSNPNFVDFLDIANSSDIFVYISLFEVHGNGNFHTYKLIIIVLLFHKYSNMTEDIELL